MSAVAADIFLANYIPVPHDENGREGGRLTAGMLDATTKQCILVVHPYWLKVCFLLIIPYSTVSGFC
jgi:hypothetical protein